MNCLHCNKYINQKQSFCCAGCKVAYSIISKLNLKEYYKYCQTLYNENPSTVVVAENNFDYEAEVKDLEGEKKQVTLGIDGIKCGACVWLVENVLRKKAGIVGVRINMSTERLSLQWQGDTKAINEYVSIVENFGYKLVPLDEQDLSESGENTGKQLLKAIAVAGFGFFQVMMFSVAVWAGYWQGSIGRYAIMFMHVVSAVIAIPAAMYSGNMFFRSAYKALRLGHANMDVPISLAILLSLLISIQEILLGHTYVYFDAALGLILALLIGRYLDLAARNQAKSKVKRLLMLEPKSVTVIREARHIIIKPKDLKPDEIIFVAPGEKIGVDGEITKGESEIDVSSVTGETVPDRVTIGAKVYAGTINVGNAIEIKASAVGQDTMLSHIIRLIENAERSKAKYMKISEGVAKLYTPIVFLVSALTFIFWYYINNAFMSTALLYAVSVLIITCPCALGLAVPIVQVIATSSLMNKGIMLKSSTSLERVSQVDTVAFDKTGTLTLGEPKLINLKDIPIEDQRIIKTIAYRSNHPLCKALRDIEQDVTPGVNEVKEIKGKGLLCEFEGQEIKLGSRKWCEIDTKDDDKYLEMWYSKTNGVSLRLKFEDKIRPEAFGAIQTIRDMGMSICIISGDRREAVEDAAKELHIEEFYSGISPEGKYNLIQRKQESGNKILMVGDGLNDSASLKAAFASASPTQGLDIAQNSADVVFQPDLGLLVKLIASSKSSIRIVKQNILLSIAYNIMTIPIAVMGRVTPIVAALAMSTSSIVVILNSLRLKRQINYEKSKRSNI